MKRFHVHTHVQDLQANISFYTRLFGTEPTRLEPDYAKWMLEDPRINFAISTRGGALGIDHLGFQADTPEELAELKARAEAAAAPLLDEGQTTCCYARSDKHWVTDPQGMAWEQFHTLAGIPTFNESPAAASTAVGTAACCTPAATAPRAAGKAIPIAVRADSSCC